MARRLEAFPVVEVDGVRMWVDQVRPVAVLQRPGRADQVVGWPDLFTGWSEPATTAVPAPSGVWVHYGLLNSVGGRSPLAAVVNDVDAPAVHIDAASGRTSVVHTGRHRVLGATRHGLWTTSTVSRDPDPDPDDPYLGGPLPDGWHQDTHVTVHHEDGTARQVVVDRDVLAVTETGQQLQILVHASPAIATPGPGGSTGYGYRPTELVLPADDRLPERVRFRELVPDGWGPPADLTRTSWPQRSAMLPPITGGTPAADVDWTVVEPAADVQQRAVEFVTEQFVDLEHYWHPEGGGPASPLSRGLRDATVRVVGDHPHTRVEVDFRHPAYPQGRLRRIYDVYDSAGRIRIDDSLAIWLMEDLATRDLPSAALAVDGVLTI